MWLHIQVIQDRLSRSIWWLIIGMLSATAAGAFEGVAIVTAMPKAAEALGNVGLYAWTFSAAIGGQILAIGIVGRICDRNGAENPLIAGFIFFISGLILAGFASNMYTLIFFRFLQGVGIGAINLTVMVLIGELFNPKRQAQLMVAFSFCWMVPGVAGPTVAVWVATHFGWRWVFWCCVPLLSLALAIIFIPLRKVHASGVDKKRNPTAEAPWWAVTLVAVGAALIQVGGQSISWLSLIWLVVALGILGFALPKVMPGGFSKLASGLPSAVMTRGLQVGSYYATEVFLSLVLTSTRGLSFQTAGLLITLGSVGWTVGSWVQERPWLRIRRDQVVILGAGCGVIGLGIVAGYMWWQAAPLWLVVLGWLTTSFGMGLATASLTLATIALSTKSELGYNMSSLQVGEGLGNSLIVGVAGTLFASCQAAGHTWLGFGLIYTLTALLTGVALGFSARIGPVRNESSGVG